MAFTIDKTGLKDKFIEPLQKSLEAKDAPKLMKQLKDLAGFLPSACSADDFPKVVKYFTKVNANLCGSSSWDFCCIRWHYWIDYVVKDKKLFKSIIDLVPNFKDASTGKYKGNGCVSFEVYMEGGS